MHKSTLSWEVSIPLVTNPFILRHFAGLYGAITGVFIFFLGGAFAIQEEWQIAREISLLLVILGTGIYLFTLIIMLVFYGNRQMLCFTLSDKGIGYKTINQRTERLGLQQESWQVYWRGAFRALVYPRQRCILLRNSWRTLMVVYCTPENFESVSARIKSVMAVHGTADRVVGKSPLVITLWRTVLFVVAIFPILKLLELLNFDNLLGDGFIQFFIIFIICFGLVTIWLIPLMAWPVLIAIFGVLGYVPIYLLQSVHTTFYDFSNSPDSFIQNAVFPRWQVLDEQEIFWMVLGLISIFYLVMLLIGFLRSQKVSLMMSDGEDSGW